MNQPSPALVAQDAVRRLPHWALWLLGLAYVVPGYVARDPWKGADITTFGVMLELHAHPTWQTWLHPTLMPDMPADAGVLLPYWLGAWALQLAPGWLAPEVAVRLPFMLMLAGALMATWYAVRDLARHPGAQPVAFAFGGEASSSDYARALADGSLLALVACLGLAQLSHETSPALAQLFFVTLVFAGLAGLPFRTWAAPLTASLGLIGLGLSGAPWTAFIYGSAASFGLLRPGIDHLEPAVRRRSLAMIGAVTLICALLIGAAGLARWQLALPTDGKSWRSLARLYLWFSWPVWPLVLWALWRWRHQLAQPGQNRHLGLPILIAGVPMASTVLIAAGDRALLLALPALACLAAFALPTFKRSAAALIDWFTVLFFTGCAIIIWIVWISLQTGVPAKPAANIARLAPGFEPVLQWPALVTALAATAAWLALARWRTGHHRTALWKSLVLPAAGATLCWLLLLTLWLPALNYGRSFAPQMRALQTVIGWTPCIAVHGLTEAQVAAVRFHGGWPPRPATQARRCTWLLSDADARASLPEAVDMSDWRFVDEVPRPTDKDDTLLIYRRLP